MNNNTKNENTQDDIHNYISTHIEFLFQVLLILIQLIKILMK